MTDIVNNKRWNSHQQIMFRNIYVNICGNEKRLFVCTSLTFLCKANVHRKW